MVEQRITSVELIMSLWPARWIMHRLLLAIEIVNWVVAWVRKYVVDIRFIHIFHEHVAQDAGTGLSCMSINISHDICQQLSNAVLNPSIRGKTSWKTWHLVSAVSWVLRKQFGFGFHQSASRFLVLSNWILHCPRSSRALRISWACKPDLARTHTHFTE